VIADMSSDLMTDVFDPSACAMAYAHAQKNIGFVGLAGHRSLGGCRASLFNGVTHEAVDRLVGFMDDFARRNQQEALGE
jgi:phosphoserine aminotransferase